MALNLITVTFAGCTPTPPMGYNIQYRPVAGGAYRDGGNFTTSPAEIYDINDAGGTDYEGYIRGDCGDGNLGPNVTFTTA